MSLARTGFKSGEENEFKIGTRAEKKKKAQVNTGGVAIDNPRSERRTEHQDQGTIEWRTGGPRK